MWDNLVMGLDRTRSPSERAETSLTAAVMTGHWIRSAAVDDERGRHWQANPDPGGRSALAAEPASLYAGAAGIVLFFLDLAAATGRGAYLEDVRAGARYLWTGPGTAPGRPAARQPVSGDPGARRGAAPLQGGERRSALGAPSGAAGPSPAHGRPRPRGRPGPDRRGRQAATGE
jgi:hypothetical protein